jgi:hypothetical protein
MIIETVPDNMCAVAKKFAIESVDTNYDEYSRRNQFDKDKIIFDITTGKIAEYGVCLFLKKMNIGVTKPDIKIYDKNNKSFDADLKTEKYNIHIKSQDYNQSIKFGESWMFQKRDKLTTSPSENDLIAFCIVKGNQVYLKKMIQAIKILDKYKAPKKESLRDSKVTIYYDDLWFDKIY